MELEKIINGKIYSTSTADEIWSTIEYHSGYDINVSVYKLYKTAKGNYFLVYSPNIDMCILSEVNNFDLDDLDEYVYRQNVELFNCTPLDITALTEEDAKILVLEKGSYSEFTQIFDSEIEYA